MKDNMILKNDESINYYGGETVITAALITSIISLLKFTYSLGKEIGKFLKENYLNSN